MELDDKIRQAKYKFVTEYADNSVIGFHAEE